MPRLRVDEDVNKSYYLGIDAGTSGLKALLVDAHGAVAGHDTSAYPLHTPCPGCAESDPADWWAALGAATRGALRVAGIAGAQVAAIGLSGQMHTLVLLDEDGRPVRPAISWADTRGAEERAEIEARVGRDRLIAITGSPAATAFTATRLLWVRRHEPAAWDRARTMFLPKDYLRLHLTGERATDPSDAGASGLLDLRARDWSPDVLAALELPRALLPEIRPSDAIAGRLTDEAARALGLVPGTPVATGAGDQECAAFGCGITSPGPLLITVGTGGQVFAATTGPLIDPQGRIHALPHALPDRWHVLAAIPAAGLALTWLQRLIAPAHDMDGLIIPAHDVGGHTTAPPLFLPAVAGERTPSMDEGAHAALFGLDLTHTRGDLLFAAREGVTFALRACLDVLGELGVPADPILVTGGLSADAGFVQLLANVLGRPVAPAAQREGSAYGAALLGARAAGLPWQEGPPPMGPAVAPDAAATTWHDRRYALYRQLYPALKEVTG